MIQDPIIRDKTEFDHLENVTLFNSRVWKNRGVKAKFHRIKNEESEGRILFCKERLEELVVPKNITKNINIYWNKILC